MPRMLISVPCYGPNRVAREGCKVVCWRDLQHTYILKMMFHNGTMLAPDANICHPLQGGARIRAPQS